MRWINVTPVSKCFPIEGECPSRKADAGVIVGGIMKLLRTTVLTAALIAIAVPSLTSSAQAWRWRGAGWRAAAVGAAVVGSAIAARSYYGYGYPAYGYGYGSSYSYPAYGYGTGIVRRGLYAAAWRRWR